MDCSHQVVHKCKECLCWKIVSDDKNGLNRYAVQTECDAIKFSWQRCRESFLKKYKKTVDKKHNPWYTNEAVPSGHTEMARWSSG